MIAVLIVILSYCGSRVMSSGDALVIKFAQNATAHSRQLYTIADNTRSERIPRRS